MEVSPPVEDGKKCYRWGAASRGWFGFGMVRRGSRGDLDLDPCIYLEGGPGNLEAANTWPKRGSWLPIGASMGGTQ